MYPSEVFLYALTLIGFGFALGVRASERAAFKQYEQDRLARNHTNF